MALVKWFVKSHLNRMALVCSPSSLYNLSASVRPPGSLIECVKVRYLELCRFKIYELELSLKITLLKKA